MPEGVEIRMYKHSLEKYEGCTLNDFIIHSGRYERHTKPQDIENFKESLPTKIKKIQTKGKFLWIEYQNGWYQGIHFGMKGKFTFTDKRDKHDHFEWDTSCGIFRMNDYRNFGTIGFYPDKKSFEKHLKQNGIDPLEEKITKGKLKTMIERYIKGRRTKKTLAEFLLEQDYIAGIGNYMRAEIVYNAKLPAFLELDKIKDEEVKKLADSINHVFDWAYKEAQKGKKIDFEVYTRKKTKRGEDVKATQYKTRTMYHVDNYI